MAILTDAKTAIKEQQITVAQLKEKLPKDQQNSRQFIKEIIKGVANIDIGFFENIMGTKAAKDRVLDLLMDLKNMTQDLFKALKQELSKAEYAGWAQKIISGKILAYSFGIALSLAVLGIVCCIFPALTGIVSGAAVINGGVILGVLLVGYVIINIGGAWYKKCKLEIIEQELKQVLSQLKQ